MENAAKLDIVEKVLLGYFMVWEILLYMCCFYQLMNKESALACDRVE